MKIFFSFLAILGEHFSPTSLSEGTEAKSQYRLISPYPLQPPFNRARQAIESILPSFGADIRKRYTLPWCIPHPVVRPMYKPPHPPTHSNCG
ncbi:hypothetical protein CEXT_467231 [Caerostris extrusa]|uniref:Secreted protein n=1 Tax=Caerostris extrusa TaxID=172846 RepID=A0AAV4WE13_CAEEX|nr:hypothetical protein CEXT_467231 [Caerostris extrusa]